jgi:myosin heavy subunit
MAMKTIEHEGETYVLKSDSDQVIQNFKTDMEKYKAEKNDLKKEVSGLKDDLKNKDIEIETANDKLESVGAKEDEIKNAKTELAEVRGQVKRLTSDLEKANKGLSEKTSSFNDLVIENNLRTEISKTIHPDSIDMAVKLLRQDANIDDSGVLTMGAEKIDVPSFIKGFAEKNPRLAVDRNAQTGAGIADTGLPAGKSFKEMTKSEKTAFMKSDPEGYRAAIKDTWAKPEA